MNKKEPSNIAWLYGQVGEKRGRLFASILIAICNVAFGILPFLIAAEIMRTLMAGNRDVHQYQIFFCAMAGCVLGKALAHAISTSLSHAATFQILANIRKRGCDRLTKMPLGDVQSHSAGELKNILVERVDAMETTLAHIVPEFTSNILAPVCLLGLLFWTDWRMALAALLVVPVGMLCFMGMMLGYEENFSRTVKATHALNDTAVEYIEAIQVIKAFSKVGANYARFVAAARECADSYVSWMRRSSVFFVAAMNVMPATLLTVLPIGGYLTMKGSLSGEDFLFCIILSLALIGPLITCMSYTDDLGTLQSLTDEVRSIVDAPVMERPETMKETPDGYGLKLENVHFAYQEKEVLHGISMEIPEAGYVAFVGPSGSGKSTIARLIASLWDVKGGQISLGGVDIRNIPLDQYNDYIAYVSQDNYLFNQTIRENIRMGKTLGAPATDEEVEEAAKRSGCYDFIMGLEHGFDTVVGSSGGHLSGGERQRIAIARAMLKDAPIVILDEATAYTDPENESIIQQSVAKLVEGKTLIVIAHRLSTVKDADRIFVIENGRIAQQGTHEELLQKQGLYHAMWSAHISVKDHSEASGEVQYA